MAQIPVSIAVSPSGTTLLAAQQVTNTASTVVFNEVVTLGDASSGNVGAVLTTGAALTQSYGGGTLGYNQVVVTSATGGTLIVAARANREGLVIVVGTTTASNVYLGDVNVSQATGLPLLVGQAINLPTTAAVYGVASGTTTSNSVAYLEIYG